MGVSVTIHWAHTRKRPLHQPGKARLRHRSVEQVFGHILNNLHMRAHMRKKAHMQLRVCAHVAVRTSIHSSFSCSLAACKMNDRLVPVNYDESTHALHRVSE